MSELSIQQKELITQLKISHPELAELSDAQILSVLNSDIDSISLSEEERISILSIQQELGYNGLSIQRTGNTKTKPRLTTEEEAEVKEALMQRLNSVTTNLENVKKDNGFLGKLWHGIKNFTHIGASSNKVLSAQEKDLKALNEKSLEEAFKEITGEDYTEENLQKFLEGEIKTTSETKLDGYAEGQEMAADTMADLVSGILSFGIYVAAVAAAPVTGGASIALGVALATATGAGIKVGVKALDTLGSDRKYSKENLKRDLATGGFSGLLAPITGGVGSVIGKATAKACGLQVMKQVGKELVEAGATYGARQGIKSALVNAAGFEYVGGKFVKRALAYGAEMATDGALGGMIDNAFRTYYDGGDAGDVATAAVQGFVGGAAMAPVIGGGMRGTGKLARKVFGKSPDIEVRKSKLQKEYDKRTLKQSGYKPKDSCASVNETNIELAEKLLELKIFEPWYADSILRSADTPEKVKTKVDFINRINSKSMYTNRRYFHRAYELIEYVNNPQMADLVESILAKNNYINTSGYGSFNQNMSEVIYIMSKAEADDVRFEFLRKFLANEKFDRCCETHRSLANIIRNESFTKETMELYEKLSSNIKFKNDREYDMYLSRILFSESNECTKLKIKIIDKFFPDEKIAGSEVVREQLYDLLDLAGIDFYRPLVEAIIADEKIYSNPKITEKLVGMRFNTSQVSVPILLKILSDEKLYSDENIIKNLISISKGHKDYEQAFKLLYLYIEKKDVIKNENFERAIFNSLNSHLDRGPHYKFLQKIIDNEELYNDPDFMRQLPGIIENLNSDNIAIIEKLYNDENFPVEKLAWFTSILSHTYGRSLVAVDRILSDPDLSYWEQGCILSNAYSEFSRHSNLINFIERIYTDETLIKNKSLLLKLIGDGRIKNDTVDFSLYMLESYQTFGFSEEHLNRILYSLNNKYAFGDFQEFAIDLCKNYKTMNCTQENAVNLIEAASTLGVDGLKRAREQFGDEIVFNLRGSDYDVLLNFQEFYGKTSIDQLPLKYRKELLRKCVEGNSKYFNCSDKLREILPLLPRDQHEYCKLVSEIAASIGITTKSLDTPQIAKFNLALDEFSGVLSRVTDEDFANLHIRQDYSRDDFIKKIREITEELSDFNRKTVLDFFGFDLQVNPNSPTGYVISGYPANLHSLDDFVGIADPKMTEVINVVKDEVIRFSEKNPIRCENPQVEKLLNDILEVLPELRTQIGKQQHGTHDYDIFQHSLKVMQKISQDPQFKALSESDKKVMSLVALLHDITKLEGAIDKTHATEGAFDAFYIAKKFNLSREEEIKLYMLAKHHEWLEYVNTSRSEEELTKRLQSVAYDLRIDNLFDLALMFTHADLRAVKKNDSFHDTVDGASRVLFDGKTRRSYGESADVYAKRIREYVLELKKSQPLLPVTQVPTASKIAQAIKTVNPDGSTNIKGVYKDTDGLIVIKFNEVEDWEAMGFPKGTTARGVKGYAGMFYGGNISTRNFNTGNIHFFAHGLEYENQLTKFGAFSLPDSEALLSITYVERPESKYRFFRPQGILLDFETKYVHGGGNTDAGSGYGKNLVDFKNNYIFGGKRESDRLYVSNLIKKALKMDDDEYLRFIKENENKPFTEIYPVELREKIIKALASIKSHTRRYNRSYNEMYGTNPRRVMGVFAYDIGQEDAIGNPIAFLHRTKKESYDVGAGSKNESVAERTAFLRQFALDNDIPFFVFGD